MTAIYLKLNQNLFSEKAKSLTLTFALHILILGWFFAFSKPKVAISDYSNFASFNLVNNSYEENINFKKNQTKNNLPAEKKIAAQNNNPTNNNSMSEPIFNADYLNNPKPQYPILSKRRGEEGVVLVKAFIDENGLATKVEVEHSSSFSMLDEAAIEAIKKWQFIPAKRFGQNTASSVIIPINFKLS